VLAGPLAGELGRLVPEQAARLPALRAQATRDPAGERYRLFEAAAALLAGAAAERPLLLVLDDLHWAERPTLLLLRHLVRAELGPVFLLASRRPRWTTCWPTCAAKPRSSASRSAASRSRRSMRS